MFEWHILFYRYTFTHTQTLCRISSFCMMVTSLKLSQTCFFLRHKIGISINLTYSPLFVILLGFLSIDFVCIFSVFLLQPINYLLKVFIHSNVYLHLYSSNAHFSNQCFYTFNMKCMRWLSHFQPQIYMFYYVMLCYIRLVCYATWFWFVWYHLSI